jgi:hypothetical protein
MIQPMSIVRGSVAALVLVLLLVPALTRAGQALEAGPRSTQASGFHKSFDFPPAPFVVSPDRTRTAEQVIRRSRPLHGDVVRPDESLPTAPFVVLADPLRAPPVNPS